MRAVRFSSVLGFKIEENTAAAAIECAPKLCGIAVERILTELKKTLCGSFFHCVESGFEKVFEAVFGAENIDFSKFQYVKETSGGFSTKLLCILKDMESAEMVCRRLKLDKALAKRIALAADILFSISIVPNRIELKKLVSKFGFDVVSDALNVLCVQKDTAYNDALDTLYSIENDRDCISRNMLKINGSHLKELGITDGREIGCELDMLLNEVMEGKVKNSYDDLKRRVLLRRMRKNVKN